jgi:hypothetical protein
MIHEIVSSDVDFARGMMDSGRSDTEILAYLASRGLEPAKAAELMDDLRHGRTPSAKLPFELRPPGHRAVGGRGTARGEAHPAQHAYRNLSGSWKRKLSAIPWWFVVLVGIALFALGYVLLEAGSRLSREGIDKDKHELPPAADKQP